MSTTTDGSEDFTMIMNGTSRPEGNEFDVLGLKAGSQYRFKL